MTTQEYAKGLRMIAEWYEAHSEAPIPELEIKVIYVEETPEGVAALARNLGSCEKEYTDVFFKLVKDFGGIKLKFFFWRSTVCTRKVVGKKVIPAQPAQPEREVDVIEWECPESLLGS